MKLKMHVHSILLFLLRIYRSNGISIRFHHHVAVFFQYYVWIVVIWNRS